MNETQNDSQTQEPKTYELATWALGLAVIGSLSLILHIGPGIYALPLALVFGSISLFRIKKSTGQLKGVSLATGAIVISVVALAVIIWHLVTAVRLANQMLCACNIGNVGRALGDYSNDWGGKYPTSDKWCDLLVQHRYVPEKLFVCRGGGKERSHYAINPDAATSSPNDIVLLFETKGGWNQFGGAELLTFQNHKPRGAHVFFNDGHIEFVEPAQLKALKWKVEDSNSGGEGFSK